MYMISRLPWQLFTTQAVEARGAYIAPENRASLSLDAWLLWNAWLHQRVSAWLLTVLIPFSTNQRLHDSPSPLHSGLTPPFLFSTTSTGSAWDPHSPHLTLYHQRMGFTKSSLYAAASQIGSVVDPRWSSSSAAAAVAAAQRQCGSTLQQRDGGAGAAFGTAASLGVQVSNPKSLTYCSLIVSPWFLSSVEIIPPAFLHLFPNVPFLVSGRSSQTGELTVVPRSLF
jgi:hypothetical protein